MNIDRVISEVRTPCYVYDAEVIRERHQDLVTTLPAKSKFFYAMKALSNLKILRLMKSLGCGLDTVSLFEMQMGLDSGFKPDEIIFTPNVVDVSELEKAIDLGVGINIENLSNLKKIGQKYGGSVPVCIRFNPRIGFKEKDKHIADWYEESKFGIQYSRLNEILDLVDQYKMNVEGLHIHSSHVIMREDILHNSARLLMEAAIHFPRLKYLDFGGGLNPTARKNDATDIKTVGVQLATLLKEFEHKTGRDIHLRFEPGRFLVSEAGTLYVKATVIKRNREVTFAGVDSGFNHFIRPMFYGSNHDIINFSNPLGEMQEYNVVGNLCEVDDFAKRYKIANIEEGDILAIKDTGAYGFSMSSQYNSRPRPAEVFIDRGEAIVIREREGFEDMLRNQVERKLSL